MRQERRAGRMPEQWRVSLAGMAAVGVTFGFARYGYGLFLPEFRRAFDLPLSLVGLIASASYVGYIAALLLVGALVTRLGPRPLVVAGGLSAAGGMALVACADGPITLTAGLVLAGTSPGWVWAPYSDAVDRTLPPDRRERAMGAIATGTAFAVALAGPLTLAAQGGRWRHAWLAFAAAALLATLANARVLPGGGRARPTEDRTDDDAAAAAAAAAGQSPPRPGLGWLARRPAAAAALLGNARVLPGGGRARPAADRAHTAARQPSPRPGRGWLARRPAAAAALLGNARVLPGGAPAPPAPDPAAAAPGQPPPRRG
ncbi:MFS transporter, partial [Streptomyces sp. NPDC059037]|uniref:MFS transporter n=1 Tax=Streptomyces sp. NPDC059037 TaxID=3346710 RepID=UPI0036CF8E64